MSPGPVTLGKTLSWRLLLLDQRVDPVCLCPPGSTNRAEVLESMFSSLTLKGFPYILILFCPLSFFLLLTSEDLCGHHGVLSIASTPLTLTLTRAHPLLPTYHETSSSSLTTSRGTFCTASLQ